MGQSGAGSVGQRTLTISPEDFDLFELVRGAGFSRSAPWIDGQRAWIPLAKKFISEPRAAPPENAVVLRAVSERDRTTVPLVWRDGDKVVTAVDVPGWIDMMRAEGYRREHERPVSARLPFHYHRLPGALRNFLARRYLKSSDGARFPREYLNCGPEIFVAAVSGAPAPEGQPTVVLTHDIDTARGFDLVERIAKLEENLGFRSAWHVVADHYPIDEGLLRELRRRGHEIGLHGLWHTNREAFLEPPVLRAELARVVPLIEAHGMRGYRGPSWYRTAAMYPVLAEFFDYDLSCLDIDLSCPGGPGGVGVARPFRKADGLIEIPCTLPFETPIHQGREISGLARYWGPKIDLIRRVGGLLVVNTHPDPNYLGNPLMLAEYETLLRRLADESWSCRLPAQVAAETGSIL